MQQGTGRRDMPSDRGGVVGFSLRWSAILSRILSKDTLLGGSAGLSK